MNLAAFLLTIAVILKSVFGYSNGAPEDACITLEPGHGFPARDVSTIPFELKVGRQKGGGLEVTLQGTGWLTSTVFKGFIIQVRRKSDNAIVGSFNLADNNNAKFASCSPLQSTVTHQKSEDKELVVVMWNPPANFHGQVYVAASVVEDYENYWVDFRSDMISLAAEDSTKGSDVYSEPEPESEAEPELDSEPEPEPQKPRHTIYNGCYTSKGCFGIPGNCEEQGTCQILATWDQRVNSTIVELYSAVGVQAYAAFALSLDSKMGEDLVFSCAEVEGRVRVETSWNTGIGSEGGAGKNNLIIADQESFQVYEEGRVQDGLNLYCKMRVSNFLIGYPPIPGSSQYIYELDRQPYHLLVAGGTYTDKMEYHGGLKLASRGPINFKASARVKASSPLLIQIHGSLMIAAWVGCAGTGILIARYFKDTWRGSDCCSTAQWFVWHRIFMILTWLLTILGIGSIVMEVGGWSHTHTHDDLGMNPHPLLGIITLGLVTIQPFVAMLRPSPEASYRWIFNWAHWFIGNAAHIVAIVAIFFAVGLDKAGLPAEITWLIVAYVAWYVGTHLILSLNTCWADHNPSPRSQIYPLSGRNSSGSGYIEDIYINKDRRGGGCRVGCLALYFVLVLVLAACIIFAIVIAPTNFLVIIGLK